MTTPDLQPRSTPDAVSLQGRATDISTDSAAGNPQVSVVITTLRRSHLVMVAIQSVLTQTFAHLELIVVVDGPDDPETVAVLKTVTDPRFQFVVLPQNVKLAGARNAGVAVAKAPWIAFLDDDDAWLPEKLEKQLAQAQNSDYAQPIVSSRLVAETSQGKFIWPRRLPRAQEPVGDYLFIRNSLFQGEGMVLPSTLLAPKALLEAVPFVHGKHEDYDWLLRACSQAEVGLEFVAEPMVIWHFHQGKGLQRLSQINNWKESLAWVQDARSQLSPQAYSAFIVQNVSPPAAAVQDWSAFWPLLKEFILVGNARPFDYARFLAMWLIPQGLRQRLRQLLSRSNPKKSSALTSSTARVQEAGG